MDRRSVAASPRHFAVKNEQQQQHVCFQGIRCSTQSFNGDVCKALCKRRYLKTRLGTAKDYAEALLTPQFHSGMDVGAPHNPEKIFEISRRPHSIRESTPVILGFSILCSAKVKLLSFIYKLTLYLRPGSWAITGGDTDSCGTFLSSPNIDELVRDELKAEWEEEKKRIFVDENDPRSKRTPGLWKAESVGSSLIHLSSKLYSILAEDTGEHKVAVRGGNIRGNRALLTHQAFLASLRRPLTFDEYLKEHRLYVSGFHRLSPLEDVTVTTAATGTLSSPEAQRLTMYNSEGELVQDWDAVTTSLDTRALREEEQRAGQAALAWEKREEEDRLAFLHSYQPHPREDPLSLTNIQFRKDANNHMYTISTNKSILLALHCKRQIIGDGCRTIPLPELGLQAASSSSCMSPNVSSTPNAMEKEEDMSDVWSE